MGKNGPIKIICASLLLFGVLFLWSSLSLVKDKDRPNNFSPSAELKAEIKAETAGMSAEDIRAYSIKKTASTLSFTIGENLSKGEANCMGYAKVCASICNCAFKANGLKATAKPVVGYVMLYGINLCNVLKACMPTRRMENFVKDHDFVEFHIDGQTIFADACIYDILWNDCKTISE